MDTSDIDITFHVSGESVVSKLEAGFDPTKAVSTSATRCYERGDEIQ